MTDDTIQTWPRLWPVGARLRFKRNAEMYSQFRYLRGTPVLVLNEARDFRDQGEGVRQRIYVFRAACAYHRVGWARPSQLEPIPDQTDDEGAAEEAAEQTSEVRYPASECGIGMPEQVDECL